jgi:DNA mismatch repair protein MutL
MSRIKILSEIVASQIAAGEVVQRPASVVKELVDNALDAGAGRINIEVEKGGNSKIRVEDDGCGMSREELPIALRRHATSKIESEADLLAIQTYGFRGEALAAISSVAHVEIISRQPFERQGTRLLAVGGEVKALEPIGAPPGTSVCVSELFFNTPARKKFLKTPTTEMERTSEIFIRTAIGQPGLHVELSHNGKKARQLPAVPSTLERLVQIFGADLVAELLPVDQANDRIQITGFTCRPTTHRNTASDLYFYVNRRFVRDRLLLRALVEAYRASLPQRRYPVTVLFIDLPPEQVDVNVHPSKEEIRFRDERFIWSAVYSAVREAISGSSQVFIPTEATPDTASLTTPWEGAPPAAEPLMVPTERSEAASVTRNDFVPASPLQVVEERIPFAAAEPPPAFASTPPVSVQQPGRTVEALNRAPLASLSEQRPAEAKPPLQPERAWRAVAQIFDSYIVAEAGDMMAVFDQHALHERLQFERFRRQYQQRSIERQSLLIPLTIEVAPHRVGLLTDSLGLLSSLGLEMEPFGDSTFVVRTVPADMNLAEVKDFVEDALSDMADQGVVAPLSNRAERVLSIMACRSAIKAGDPLSGHQMQDLIDRYSSDPALATCPHGRPPVWKISRKEIEKWFDRG